MNADDRFMDLLLERTLGEVEVAPQADAPAETAEGVQTGAGPRTRPWAWAWAAAVVVLAVGGLLARQGKQPRTPTPAGIHLADHATFSQVGDAVRIDTGYALIDAKAPPVVFGDGVVKPVDGQVIVCAGGIPSGDALSSMVRWLQALGGSGQDAAHLRIPERWIAGGGTALALLSGGLLLSGHSELAWAGRPWVRDLGYTPPRVALVTTPAAVDRLGRLTGAVKVAVVDADGRFARALAQVGTLTHVDLSGCLEVDDEALRHLSRLERLQTLDVSFTQVGNRGLAWLSRLEGLRHLSLRGLTGVTAHGLQVLADTHAHQLLRLDLRGGARIEAAVVEALARCTHLTSLSISCTTALDEAQWAPLRALTGLRTLHLETEAGRTPDPLTPAILEKLKAWLPDCEIRVARIGSMH